MGTVTSWFQGWGTSEPQYVRVFVYVRDPVNPSLVWRVQEIVLNRELSFDEIQREIRQVCLPPISSEYLPMVLSTCLTADPSNTTEITKENTHLIWFLKRIWLRYGRPSSSR